MSRVGLVLPDASGFFVHTAARLGKYLTANGISTHYMAPNRYYERYKGVALADSAADVSYLSDFIRDTDAAVWEDLELDYWLTHPTFVRQRYFLGGHQNDWSLYRAAIAFVRKVVQDEQLALIWSEVPSGSFLRIAQREASIAGIPYLGYVAGRLPRTFNIADDPYGAEFIQNRTRTGEPSHGAPDYMDNPISTLRERGLRSEFRRLSPVTSIQSMTRALTSGRSIETNRTWVQQSASFGKQLKRLGVRRWVEGVGLFELPPERKTDSPLRILFPLHYRPEASTSVQAELYESDRQVLHNLAFSLPHKAELWVKEHPTAIGNRSPSWYREVLALPGTHLLGPTPTAGEIIGAFDAVVTLTSTVGFEALRAGLPVLVLGRVFYENYDGVVKVRSWDDLRSAVRQLSRGAPQVPDPLDRYWRTCFDGSFNYVQRSILEPPNIAALAEPILRTLSSR